MLWRCGSGSACPLFLPAVLTVTTTLVSVLAHGCPVCAGSGSCERAEAVRAWSARRVGERGGRAPAALSQLAGRTTEAFYGRARFAAVEEDERSALRAAQAVGKADVRCCRGVSAGREPQAALDVFGGGCLQYICAAAE